MLQQVSPTQPRLGLQASLSAVPLGAVLELVHASSQTGQLKVLVQLPGGSLPLELEWVAGEVVAACILDWAGLDALYSFPQDAAVGELEFWQRPSPPQTGAAPLAPFMNLMGEWARLSDEWPRHCQQIGSPSQRFYGALAPFNRPGGASARWVVADTGEALHDVCAQLSGLKQAGFIHPVRHSFEWDVLVVPPSRDVRDIHRSPVLRLLDGQKTLHRLIERGFSPDDIRSALIQRPLQEQRFPGAGRALRDWLWEMQAGAATEAVETTSSDSDNAFTANDSLELLF